jgi:hypothetical protein
MICACREEPRPVRLSLNPETFLPNVWFFARTWESRLFAKRPYSLHSAGDRDNLPYHFYVFVMPELQSPGEMVCVGMNH